MAKSPTETNLAEAHRTAAEAMGEVSCALAARRGVTRARLQEWAAALRRAADKLEELAK